MDRYSLGLQLSTYMFTWGAIGNVLPFGALFIAGLLLINRLLASFVIALAAGMTFYYVSFKKNQYLGKPLSDEDFLFLRYFDNDTLELFKGYVDARMVVVAFLAILFFMFCFVRFEMRFFQKKSKGRYVGLALFVCLSLGMVSPNGASTIYDFKRMRISWNDQLSALHAGVMSKIIYTILEVESVNNEPINNEEVDYLARKYAFDNEYFQYNSEKPDIVVIQSEAFSDPTLIEGVDNLQSLLPFYAKAMEEGSAGYMKVPTFGGGTIRTEYEVLSGVPLFAYPKIEFPYMQIKSSKVDSLATEAKRNGYYTTAIHGNTGNFWNRNNFFKKAGFDKFLTIKEFPSDAKKDGFFMSDKSMTDLIITQLDNADTKKFIFSISIEAHGPYLSKDAKDDRASNVKPPEGLSPESALEFKNYLYHIRNADLELGRLHDYLEERNKPYILVFYGDHLPSFNSLYKEVTFKNNLPGRSQMVPWVMFTNTQGGRFQVSASWGLGAAVLDRAKLKKSPYFDLINNFAVNAQALNEEPDNRALLSLARLQARGELTDHLKSGVLDK
jgi:phosphoglycerol transferase MdoB-like AlkP superfamily enzyme